MFNKLIIFLSYHLFLTLVHQAEASKLFLRQPDVIEQATNERQLTVLKSVGNNNVKNLKACQGDCDRDSDCEGSLKCFQRSGVETVPGCEASNQFHGMDFCYKPGATTPSGPSTSPPRPSRNQRTPPSGSFRIKLYWELGYYWQEETIERKWCLECVGGVNNCTSGGNIEIDSCDDHYTFWEFVGSSSTVKQIKVYGTDLCVELQPDDFIQLRECDAGQSKQKFTGNFDDYRFEIDTDPNYCLSQEHHPRKNELVYRQYCPNAAKAQTSFWNKYYG